MGVSLPKSCFQDCNSEAEIQTSSAKNFEPLGPSERPPCRHRNHVLVNVRIKNRKNVRLFQEHLSVSFSSSSKRNIGTKKRQLKNILDRLLKVLCEVLIE